LDPQVRGQGTVQAQDPVDPTVALAVRGIRKGYATPEGGTVVAADGIDLDIVDNEFFVMLGPSGCGKTTLLRLIAGLEVPDDGEIWLHGERLDTLPAHRRNVNTVFQSYALFPHLTVARNVAFGLEMAGRSREETARTVEEMLDLVQLTGLGNRRPHQLSGGQQQRVALARALARHPAVLLLDEPLAALDRNLRQGMQVELKRLQEVTGTTFVFVTHDQEEAMGMGDRIAVFRDGRLAQVGTPTEIYEQPRDRFVAEFIGESNVLHGTMLAPDRVALVGGAELPLAPQGRAAGEVVTVVIRPERLRVDPAGPLRGTVERAVDMGTDVRGHVVLDGGGRLLLRVPAGAEVGLPAVGSPVALSCDPARVRIIEDEPR
jgi:spermidine/putrescine transport system ATP-binding protein